MRLSLSEADALARKAMRGAGASWGLAEEAGKAVRWLAARGLPGPEALARLLGDWPGEGITGDAGAGWDGPSGRLCPIRAGTLIADHSGLLEGADIRLGPVAVPLLLQPFAEMAGYAPALPLDLDGAPITLHRSAAEMTPPSATNCPIDAATRARLESWAHATYVPASDASRAGAGSAGSDND